MQLEQVLEQVSGRSEIEVCRILHVYLLKMIVLHGFAIQVPSAVFMSFLETIRHLGVTEALTYLPDTFDPQKSRSYIDQCVAYFLST